MRRMTDLSSKSCLVIDGGLFAPLAHRLARDFGRVYFHNPFGSQMPMVTDAVIGDGFSDIELVHDLWEWMWKADVIVIPDVGHSDLKKQLEPRGKPVWGSGTGDFMELQRAKFRQLQKELGLAVPPHNVIAGWDDLAAFLEVEQDCYVKVSKFRGLMETHHWIGMKRDAQWLDALAVKLGPLKNKMQFIVEAPIDAVSELGVDTFCIDGQYPKTLMTGIESKDKAYLGTVVPEAELAPQLVEINRVLAPVFKEHRYRNFWSNEVRIAEDKTPYLTDPTCREASPAGECLLENITNLSEIIWHGAQGELVEPEYEAKFAAQAIIDHHGDHEQWRVLEVPESVKRWVKVFACCEVDGVLAIPPCHWSSEIIGSVIGLGDTIQDAIDALRDHAAELDGQPLTIHVEALADVLKTIQEQEDAGIELTDQPVPEPAAAIEHETS